MPLQGDRLTPVITQGVALGYELLPLQGVLGNFNRIEGRAAMGCLAFRACMNHIRNSVTLSKLPKSANLHLLNMPL